MSSSTALVVNAQQHDSHAASEVGFSFDANSAYNASRPSYSDVCVNFVLQEALLWRVEEDLVGGEARAPSGSPVPEESRMYRIVDLGAGTGLFTRCLLHRLSAFSQRNLLILERLNIQFEVIIIDPNPRYACICVSDSLIALRNILNY
jgi:hypothetical protein